MRGSQSKIISISERWDSVREIGNTNFEYMGRKQIMSRTNKFAIINGQRGQFEISRGNRSSEINTIIYIPVKLKIFIEDVKFVILERNNILFIRYFCIYNYLLRIIFFFILRAITKLTIFVGYTYLAVITDFLYSK